MNQSTGLVTHRVEVVAEGTGGRQLEPQMFEPKSERDSLFQQQPGVLVFAAAVETAQHQEKIDDIGIGAGPPCLGRSRVWPARNSASASRNNFFFLACRSRSSSMRSTIEGSKRGEFRSENRSIAVNGGQED
jgi:hypothetical protein